MTNLHIGPATPDLVETVVALMESAYRGAESLTGWTSEDHLIDGSRTNFGEILSVLEDPKALMLIARDSGGVVVGCASIAYEHGACSFGKYAVTPRQQGHGIGKSLLAAAEESAIARFNAIRMTMMVIDGRIELEAFYERRGYCRTGHVVKMANIHDGEGMTRGGDLLLNEYAKPLLR